jgi:hypothetical protein
MAHHISYTSVKIKLPLNAAQKLMKVAVLESFTKQNMLYVVTSSTSNFL